MQSLAGFELQEVLGQDARSKTVAILGRFKEKEGQAVIRLSKQHFNLEKLQQLASHELKLTADFTNDIYHKFAGQPPADHAAIMVDMTYPATEKHISKHREQAYCMVRETPEKFHSIHQPYIQSIPSSRIQWVYNMLEGKAEQERMIFHEPDPDSGFMLHPDLKWDQVQKESLYCLAICNRRDITCLRDLRAEHVPMLQSIESKCLEAIQQKWGVPAEHVRAYLHYPPSYYHLHIHFCHVHFEGPGMAAGKAHLLADIIDMLQLEPSIMLLRTFLFTLGDHDPLWKAWVSKTSSQGAANDASKRRRIS